METIGGHWVVGRSCLERARTLGNQMVSCGREVEGGGSQKK